MPTVASPVADVLACSRPTLATVAIHPVTPRDNERAPAIREDYGGSILAAWGFLFLVIRMLLRLIVAVLVMRGCCRS